MEWSKGRVQLFIILNVIFCCCCCAGHATNQYNSRYPNYNSNGQYNRNANQRYQGPKKPPIKRESIGFVGGPDPDENVVEMYHLYRKILALVVFKQGRGMHFHQKNDHILLNPIPCVGGCPRPAYCDLGICRCRPNFEAKQGSCIRITDETNETPVEAPDDPVVHRNPHRPCAHHRTCHELDMNLLCNINTRKCQCKDTMKWNMEALECQVYVPLDCPLISNGTVLEPEEEEEEEEKREEEHDAKNGHNLQQQFHHQQQQFSNQQQWNNKYDSRNIPYNNNRDMHQNLNIHDVNGQRRLRDQIPLKDEEEEEKEEDEPDHLTRIDPYAASEVDIKEAFCHDMTIRYKNFTSDENEGYFFGNFGHTPAIVATFVVFAIIVTALCFYTFVHISDIHHFINEKMKGGRSKSPDLFDESVDDSDDEDKNKGNNHRHHGNHHSQHPPKAVRLFSTPEHNPNNPFNATSSPRKH